MDTPLLDYAERQALLGPRDGITFDAAKDTARLNRQMELVYGVMKDGGWYTLAELHERTGQPEASIGARTRDFRKQKFGGHTVERRRRSRGVFEYRLLVKGQS